MSALGVARLEPRDVVLAAVADARMDEAVSELESLRERLAQITAEVEASEKQAGSTPNHLELPESVQLTLQFVDDLVSTNRARMRDQVAQRYALAGERLAGAHAEAQAIVSEALAELAAAVHEHSTPREHLVDDLSRAAGTASMPPATHRSPASSSVELAQDVCAPGVDDASVGNPEALASDRANDAAAPRAVAADNPGESEERLPDQPMEALSAEGDDPESLDGVVDSAVQAILKALAGPGADASPSPPTATVRPSVTPPAGLLTWPGDSPSGLLPSGPNAADEERCTSIADDGGPHPDSADGAGDDQLGRGYEHFWRDVADASESRQSLLRPRDLMVAMLVLVALVLAGLALIG